MVRMSEIQRRIIYKKLLNSKPNHIRLMANTLIVTIQKHD